MFKVVRPIILMIQVLWPDRPGRHHRGEVVRVSMNKIVAVLTLPNGRGVLQCTNYEDASGTSNYNYVYYIHMGGGDGCCVRNSRQSSECGPEQTYVHKT